MRNQLTTLIAMLVVCAPAHAQSGETYTWTGSGCGPGNILWLNNGCAACCECENWDPVTCSMTFMDTAIIPGGFEVNMINFVEIGTLTANEGYLNISNNLTVANTAILRGSIESSSGPVVTALGPITFDGYTKFSRGTLTGSGGFTVKDGALFHLFQTGSGARIIDAATLIVEGGAEIYADLALSLRNNAQVMNAGNWEAHGTLGPDPQANQFGVFTNTGTLIHNADGSHSINVPMHNNGGTIEAKKGTLDIRRGGLHSGGEYNLSADPKGGVSNATIALHGFTNAKAEPDGVRITGPMTASGTGTLNVRGNRTIIETGGSLACAIDPGFGDGQGFLIGGDPATYLQCDGLVTNNGRMTWTQGTIGGQSPIVHQGGWLRIVAAGSTPTLETTLLSASHALLDGDLRHDQHAITSAGEWEVTSGNLLSANNAPFINNGDFFKWQPTTSTVFSSFETNTQVIVFAGTLVFRGGGKLNGEFSTQQGAVTRFLEKTYEIGASANFAGAGTLIIGPQFDPQFDVPKGGFGWTAMPGGDDNSGGFRIEAGGMHGGGEFGNGGLVTWVKGTIALGAGEPNAIDDEGGLFRNMGLFVATGGTPTSVAKILTGKFVNQNTMTGGFFTIAEGGILINNALLTLDNSTIFAGTGSGIIVNNGTLRKINAGTRTIQVPITNNETVEVQQGTLALSGGVTNFQSGVLSGGEWIIKPGATLTMPGASIFGTAAGTFVKLDGATTWTALKNFLNNNQGTLTAGGAGTNAVTPSGGTLTNGGTLESADGGMLQINGSVLNDDGGIMQQTAAPVPGDDGAAGSDPGGFIADSLNNHGTIRPGGEGAPGPFNLTGNLVCHDSSIIAIEIAGLAPIDEHDQVNIVGDMTLGGTLRVRLLDDYQLTKGDVFAIIITESGELSGTFEAIDPPAGSLFSAAYFADHVLLTYEGASSPPCPADLNDSAAVDVQDLLILLGAWGPCGKGPGSCPADLNDSGAVDVQDLLILLGAWGPCGKGP